MATVTLRSPIFGFIFGVHDPRKEENYIRKVHNFHEDVKNGTFLTSRLKGPLACIVLVADTVFSALNRLILTPIDLITDAMDLSLGRAVINLGNNLVIVLRGCVRTVTYAIGFFLCIIVPKPFFKKAASILTVPEELAQKVESVDKALETTHQDLDAVKKAHDASKLQLMAILKTFNALEKKISQGSQSPEPRVSGNAPPPSPLPRPPIDPTSGHLSPS